MDGFHWFTWVACFPFARETQLSPKSPPMVVCHCNQPESKCCCMFGPPKFKIRLLTWITPSVLQKVEDQLQLLNVVALFDFRQSLHFKLVPMRKTNLLEYFLGREPEKPVCFPYCRERTVEPATPPPIMGQLSVLGFPHCPLSCLLERGCECASRIPEEGLLRQALPRARTLIKTANRGVQRDLTP